jgi:putative transposase
MADNRLERLIRRIQRLPEEKLHTVEELLAALECGDSSPPNFPPLLECGDSSPPSSAPQSGDKMLHSKDWPHAPVHRLSDHGTYIVTAGTLHKEHLFRGAEALALLESALLRLAKEFGWHLEAWAVFSNHYHFVAHALASAKDLRAYLKQLHGETAHALNRMQHREGRVVWHNYWDTELTFEKSYLARLKYVHQNPIKHGLVRLANQYRWCSAAWFERTATPAQVKTIYSFKTEKVRVYDDFEPA